MAKHLENKKKVNKNENQVNKKSNKKKIFIGIIMFILIVLIIASCIYIYKYFADTKNSQETSEILSKIEVDEEEITDETTERMLQVKKLQEENKDVVGWLEIPDTNISYPVLQGDDNEYYMTHDYKKKYTIDGSLFLDKDYDFKKPSSNLLIYGHNNRGHDTMFAHLLDYKDEEFYKKHPIIRFTTEKEDAEYEIISVFESRVYYKSEKNVFRYYYFVDAKNEKEYNEYVENALDASLYYTGKTAEYGDQLITLSTCAFHTEDGRFAVVARKIEK